MVSYDYDENAAINGVRGTVYAGMLLGNNYRGMHGSFSPVDVHNTLIAAGPDFRERFKDTLPTGNVDVAPTVALILGVPLPRADGRPLLEALKFGAPVSEYQVASAVLEPEAPATGLTVRLSTDPDGKDIEPGKASYTFQLHTKTLNYAGTKYTYLDFAKAARR
jgi:arylsulfatase A-like enzyme